MPLMFPHPATAAGDILGAMITPAVLISASGTLALSTSNRLGRVIDRVRKLLAEAEALPPGAVAGEEACEKRALISDQISRLGRRVGLLQRALIIVYVAIGLLVGSSVAIGVSTTINEALGFLPAAFGLAGATCLLGASALLVWEVRMAVRSSLREMEYVTKVVARRADVTGGDGKP